MSKRGSTGSRKRSGAAHDAAVTLGRLGGKRGGPARAAALSPAERSAIAAKGARAKNKG